MTTHQNKKSAGQPTVEVHSITELLAHSLALEEEATERYTDLGKIMEQHNNPEAAALLSKLAEIEQLHVDTIRQHIAQHDLTTLPSTSYHLGGLEDLKMMDYADLHYLMTPRQILELVLLNERQARNYYGDIADQATDPEVVKLARELADEEQEHIKRIKQQLDQLPQTPAGWDKDDDPPILQA